MSTPVLQSVGSLSAPPAGTALTPGLPPTYNTGDALLYFTVSQGTTNTLATPSGWTNQAQSSSALQLHCFSKFAVGANGVGDTIPTVNWGGSYSQSFIAAFANIDSNFTNCFATAEKSTSSTNLINSPSVTRTPSAANCLCFIYGKRDKTATTDPTNTYSNPSGWSSLITLASGSNGNVEVATGSGTVCFAVWYQIQGTATAISPNTGASGTKTDTGSPNLQTNVLGFLSGSGGGGGGIIPPSSGNQTLILPQFPRRSIIINNYYPR